ncbi:hypothetical protein GQ53DRAFT_538708 [Thozetella sp. PMI_491]|nr:hypothetical protein GQ53DRAFT_538708 [Thozetella sp. PMI_491]
MLSQVTQSPTPSVPSATSAPAGDPSELAPTRRVSSPKGSGTITSSRSSPPSSPLPVPSIPISSPPSSSLSSSLSSSVSSSLSSPMPPASHQLTSTLLPPPIASLALLFSSRHNPVALDGTGWLETAALPSDAVKKISLSPVVSPPTSLPATATSAITNPCSPLSPFVSTYNSISIPTCSDGKPEAMIAEGVTTVCYNPRLSTTTLIELATITQLRLVAVTDVSFVTAMPHRNETTNRTIETPAGRVVFTANASVFYDNSRLLGSLVLGAAVFLMMSL